MSYGFHDRILRVKPYCQLITCTSYLFASALIYLFFGGADRSRPSPGAEEVKSKRLARQVIAATCDGGDNV